MWKRSSVDPFVVAVDRRLGAGAGRMPTDPVARREHVKAMDAAAADLLGLVPAPVATEDHIVDVADHPRVRLRVFWPGERRSEPVRAAGVPILVYFFGGSFTMGGLDWRGWDAMFRARAADAGIIVVAGEYSLAPEVRYPAQPEQCWSVFEWAAGHAAELGGDASRIAVGGASAGGNLAAAVTLMNRDRGDRPVRMQILEAPVLDLTFGHLDPWATSPVLPRLVLRRSAEPIVRDYLGPRRAIRREAYASPLLASTHAGLPPALIFTAEKDVLRGDGEAYARALAAAGVPTTCVRYVGQTHGSGGYRHHTAAADHLHRDIIAGLRTLHEPATDYPAPARPAGDHR
ncbi:alpha/beta hydrolase [Streptosporangium sp. NPDC050855]|uniref:alpha/beta hydrolase n=1 Tax=Streptosporangium sp. NPDC050855 TaxID=3366194 RepID=UPI00379B11BF